MADGLREVGFTEEEVAGILGNNWARFFVESFSTRTEDVVKPIEQPVPARFYRSHEQVMRLYEWAASHSTRLSAFLRQLLRRSKKENWSFDRQSGRSTGKELVAIVYRAQGPERCYSLVAFACDLSEEMRSDRGLQLLGMPVHSI